jgi:hypothetical protein
VRRRFTAAFGALFVAFASSDPVLADDAQAPPMLTPAAAQSVAVACPGSKPYADALVRGITLAEAAGLDPYAARRSAHRPTLQCRLVRDSTRVSTERSAAGNASAAECRREARPACPRDSAVAARR